MDIYNWKDIQDKFAEGIVLGNGASIAVDDSFSYSSLFSTAKDSALITEHLNKIFTHLETEDFELVLRMLWHTYHINQALEIEDSETSSAYKELREALIHAVKKIHIEYEEAKQHLLSIAEFLKRFHTVASLNYDVLVYWAMLFANSEWSQRWFKDCFINGEFEENWDWLREPYGIADGSTLVFYPHGNLVLASDIFGGETKVASTDSDYLIDSVAQKWTSGHYSPLFVSEGTSTQKLHAISRSPYLKSVYDKVLGDLGSRIVFFGWSVSEQDEHILKAICSNEGLRAVAVSVIVTDDVDEKCSIIEKRIEKYANTEKLEIVFFDAKSNGCWVNT